MPGGGSPRSVELWRWRTRRRRMFQVSPYRKATEHSLFQKKMQDGRGDYLSRQFTPGSDLLSHAVTSAVPSALEGLTSVFGMGTGVAPPATPPGTLQRDRAACARSAIRESFRCRRSRGLGKEHKCSPLTLTLWPSTSAFCPPRVWMNPIRRARLYTATPKAVDQALARLVPVRSTPYGAYTPGLSTE